MVSVTNNTNEQREWAWRQLSEHSATMSEQRIEDLFTVEANRATTFSASACGLLLDYSKQRISEQTFALLTNLAQSCDLDRWRSMMFVGELVNSTEARAALHVALRWPAGDLAAPFGNKILAEVEEVRVQVEHFSDAVRDASWTGFTGQPVRDVV
jgi:glucose-6-phosphate isomerase